MIDCLIIGHNEMRFADHEKIVRRMGREKGAYRDLALAFVTMDGRPRHCMDLLNLRRGREDQLSNVDFLWPVVTYLHTYLVRRGFRSDYVNLFQEGRDRLVEALRSGEVRSVAITTTLYVWSWPLVEIVGLVRKHAPDTRIIVGGPHIHNQSEAMDRKDLSRWLKALGADIYVVSSEGEKALAETLAVLKENDCGGRPLPVEHLMAVDNLVFRDPADPSAEGMVHTRRSIESNALEENAVDYSLFDARDFKGMISLRTAKSCPFSCAFCGFPQRAGKYKYTSIDCVERELDSIAQLGTVSSLSFIDDTFNVPKNRFKEILRLMIRKRYGFRWNSYLRSDHADDEAIDLMAESGCEGVFLGVETGSDRMLEAMNKTSRRADYERVICRLNRLGVISHANLIVGFPGETNESVMETFEFLEGACPTFFRAQLWYCDPLTPVWRVRDRLHVRGEGFSWTHGTMSSDEACDWVERLFLEVRGPTWLPQYGFDSWAIYYLLNKGVSLEQLEAFLGAFNNAVRNRLRDPGSDEISRADKEAIFSACEFACRTPGRRPAADVPSEAIHGTV